ncbi:uncharacterized protein LOC130895839 [Diorhabda carinulata]|uniref:uncharacterized protein LOC130895839 n=1 Tax=Diorhabda carinulata TaxID=1163345 RepID=UPI0025A171C5|nr:uncharacterized protein LOC130895839 [Diorhabda carinulata]
MDNGDKQFPNRRDGYYQYGYNKYRYHKDYRNRYGHTFKQNFAPRFREKRKLVKNNDSETVSSSHSPDIGSEEYMTQKIKETSAIIMRHLLTPEDNIIPSKNARNVELPENDTPAVQVTDKKNERKRIRNTGQSESVGKKTSFNVNEIHNKIMNHISNLSDGRKKIFISTGTPGYDEAIDQILKQRRLEISRALRNVVNETSEVTESMHWINSIIPDIGIKIEDLPKEILEELQSSFSNQEDLQLYPASLDTNLPNDIIKMEEKDSLVEITTNDLIPSDTLRENQSDVDENVQFQDKTVKMEDDDDNAVIIQDDNIETIIIDDEEPKKNKILKNNHKMTRTKKKTITIQQFLRINFPSTPKTLKACVGRMLRIDKYIEQLTQYRQNLFKVSKTNTERVPKQKKRKKVDKPACKINLSTKQSEKINSNEIKSPQKILNFENYTEKILVLRICEDKLVAGTESGKIYIFSLSDASCLNEIQITTVPISCLHFTKLEEHSKPYMFIGSFGSYLKVYNFYSINLLQDIFIEDSIQCMEPKWEYLFLGCLRGTLMRYSIKKRIVEYEEKFDLNPIFVLRATQEGARKVLLIGSRNSSVLIRDAMSGLHLRTLDTMCPTVYCIVLDKHFVYCGTTSHDILKFNFHNGEIHERYKATNSKGIGCMKIVGKCLFASCHNGDVYVYNVENNKLTGKLNGPGGVIISMEVLENQVVVGTMSCKFSSIPIPSNILNQM